MAWLWLLVAAWLGCGGPAEVSVAVETDGVTVTSGVPIDEVVVEDSSGLRVGRRMLDPPLGKVRVPVHWSRGEHSIDISWHTAWSTGSSQLTVPAPSRPEPLSVEIAAPITAMPRAVGDGDALDLSRVEGSSTQVALLITTLQAEAVRVEANDELFVLEPREGERHYVPLDVSGPTRVRVEAGDRDLGFTLDPHDVSLDQARRDLRIERVDFPAAADGSPELARPAGRITLPSPWWSTLLERTGLGTRPTGHWVPWSNSGVVMSNHGARPIDLVLRTRILGTDGEPDPAFHPRLRLGDDGTGTVSVLLRVPAGEQATATLPLFIDEDRLGEGPWTRELTVVPVGSSQPLQTWTAPLYVSRGSTAASLGMLATVLASLGGFWLVGRKRGRWLLNRPTSELMTIALFGALTFVVQLFGEAIGLGVATLLGPFSSLLTALVDDAFRFALLATLITLLPRPGTAALSVLCTWLLGGLMLGRLSPMDLLFLGSRILWLEGCLWGVGLTRSGAWREQGAWGRWARLSAGFAGASVLSTATGLVLAVVLYRLFYADWYVAMMLAGPGFLYVLAACALAVPFADSLRKVAP